MMFKFNPAQEDCHAGNRNGWTAATELVVTHEDYGTYYVDGFEDCTGMVTDKTNIWYSFDSDNGDFHLVPDESAAKGYKEVCVKLFGMISEETKTQLGKGLTGGNVKEPHVICHRYKFANMDNYQYLISFNRLWCEMLNADKKEYRIHNNFGQMQFMKYRIFNNLPRDKKTNINWDEAYNFKMMYPSSGEDGAGRFDCASGHLVYNAPFELKELLDEAPLEGRKIEDWVKTDKVSAWAQKVANCFVQFVKSGKEMEQQPAAVDTAGT